MNETGCSFLAVTLAAVITLAPSPGGRAAESKAGLLAIHLSVLAAAGTGPVELEATVTNASNRDLRIDSTNPLQDYSVSVLDASGRKVDLSQHGKDELGIKGPIHYRRVIIVMHPGESQRDRWRIDDLFEFSRPGRYRISVRRDFVAAGETDTSNEAVVDLQ